MLLQFLLLLLHFVDSLWVRVTGIYWNPITGEYERIVYSTIEESSRHDSDDVCDEKFADFKVNELKRQDPSRYEDDPVVQSVAAQTMSDDDYDAADVKHYKADGVSGNVREGVPPSQR